jgi:tripartite-type tricarboxylate transporter receptor subunit TctC
MAYRLAGILVGVAMAATATTALAADSFPSKPVHLIVPYPAGGIVDIVARSVADQVSRDWNQSVIVESKPGADSNIGTSYVAKSTPDGYTWLISGPAALVNPTIHPHAGWQPMRDFKCVGLPVWNQSVAVVPAALPVKTLKEFVAKAKAEPGHFNFGNPGAGSSIDLSAKKLFQVAGVKLTNVGYKGQPPALVDLIGNQIQFEIVSLVLALPHIKDGTIKPLATFTHERIKDLPDVPTVAEAGFPEAAFVPWYGIYVPAATPQDVTVKINAAISRALESPEVKQRLSKADVPGKAMPLTDLATLMKTDYEKLTAVVKASSSGSK